jgi:hypothetical protein
LWLSDISLAIVPVTWNLSCESLNTRKMLVLQNWVLQRFLWGLFLYFLSWRVYLWHLFMVLNFLTKHRLDPVISGFFLFFKNFNLNLQLFYFFILFCNRREQFDLLNLHKINFFYIMRKSSLALIELYFLLILSNFRFHICQLLFYLHHMQFVGIYKLLLLSFEHLIHLCFKIFSEIVQFLNRFWNYFSILLLNKN